MAPKDFVFVAYQVTGKGDIAHIEAYSTEKDANDAANTMNEMNSYDAIVQKVEVKSSTKRAAPKKGKATNTKKAKSTELVEGDDDGEAEDASEEQAPKKKTAPKKPKSDDDNPRKAIPDGIPDALKGLKLLFTGTLEIDRKTCEATAVKYGARMVTKLEDTDYIILGTKPGAKKVQEIDEKDLETITEAEFFEMLKTGVPEDKLDRMAEAAEAAAAAEEDEPKKKKPKK